MPDLEERTIESLPERCQSCGTTLTDGEKRRILDEGTAIALCNTCAIEQAPAVAEDDEEGEPGY